MHDFRPVHRTLDISHDNGACGKVVKWITTGVHVINDGAKKSTRLVSCHVIDSRLTSLFIYRPQSAAAAADDDDVIVVCAALLADNKTPLMPYIDESSRQSAWLLHT